MKVSFILPSIRTGDKFKRCMRALYDQTYKDYEVIVMDNNADRGPVWDYLWKTKWVQAYDIKENPVGRLLKRGLEHATGDIICLQNDDDYAKPHKAEFMAKFIGDYDAMITGFTTFEGKDEMTYHVPKYNFNKLIKGNYIAFCTIGWKREAFDRFEIATNYRQVWDYATLLRAGMADIRFRHVDIPTETICQHEGQMHRTVSNCQAKVDEYHRLRKELGIPNLAEEKIKWWGGEIERVKNIIALSKVG